MLLSRKKWPIFTLTIALSLIVDQASKALARSNLDPQKSIDIVKGVLSLNLVKNTGAAFGLLQGQLTILQIIAVALVGMILFYILFYRPTSFIIRVALGLIVAGSVGNLIDRALFKQVTDFIDLQVWPVFNLADSSIVAGASFLMLKSLFKWKN
ncbi:hypothetical protein LCGC14_0982750 [marine sediment metagenome]|uniref:Lipoprotein signal peptidase n=1 Tax=marine sediment metagenome TaxID=412755 RepID=A0A0F9NUH9_9ZZZZ